MKLSRFEDSCNAASEVSKLSEEAAAEAHAARKQRLYRYYGQDDGLGSGQTFDMQVCCCVGVSRVCRRTRIDAHSELQGQVKTQRQHVLCPAQRDSLTIRPF